MGVGTNVQARAIALHHLDCPWRPADIRQREGRILRQGNRNEEVRILRYVTEASFDGFVWGTVERKATFIGQVMRGRLDAREIEDIGDGALTFQEVKALATGNPLLLDQAQVQADVARLERLERAHDRGQFDLRGSVRQNQAEIGHLGNLLRRTEAAIARRRDTRGDAFSMTVEGQGLAKRPDAEARLRLALLRLARDPSRPDGRPVEVGSLGGFTVTATPRRAMRASPEVLLQLVDVPESDVWLRDEQQIADAAIVTRLENKLTGLERLGDETRQKIERLHGEVARAQGLVGKPFPQAEQLTAARARLGAIEAQLQDMAERAEKERAGQVEPVDDEPAADRRDRRQEWARQSAATPPPPTSPAVAGRPAGVIAP
jgi:hypothetical protein